MGARGRWNLQANQMTSPEAQHQPLAGFGIMLAVPCAISEEEKSNYKILVLEVHRYLLFKTRIFVFST
jgi:hypothetical protein